MSSDTSGATVLMVGQFEDTLLRCFTLMGKEHLDKELDIPKTHGGACTSGASVRPQRRNCPITVFLESMLTPGVVVSAGVTVVDEYDYSRY